MRFRQKHSADDRILSFSIRKRIFMSLRQDVESAKWVIVEVKGRLTTEFKPKLRKMSDIEIRFNFSFSFLFCEFLGRSPRELNPDLVSVVPLFKWSHFFLPSVLELSVSFRSQGASVSIDFPSSLFPDQFSSVWLWSIGSQKNQSVAAAQSIRLLLSSLHEMLKLTRYSKVPVNRARVKRGFTATQPFASKTTLYSPSEVGFCAVG